MKKLEKMSLATIAGKLTRKEMKNIMAGSGTLSAGCGDFCDGLSDATICNEFGTCHTCGPACTCI